MSETKKRKIVFAILKIRMTRGKSKVTSVVSKPYLVKGETIKEVEEIIALEKRSMLKMRIKKDFSLMDTDSFKIMEMKIKTEHGYTNYKL